MTAGLSHVRGATDTPLIEQTIGEILDRAVARWPEHDALVSLEQGIRWSYAEFGRRVDELALGLRALGLERGDRVGIWAPNCVEWTLTQFAAAKAGLIQVNVNPAYRLAELEYTLTKVGVRALIAASSFKTSDYVGMIETLAPEIVASRPGALEAARLPKLRIVAKIGGERRPGWFEFADLPAQTDAREPQPQPALGNRDPINIQFTSGTTGLPKGATLSHRNIVNNAYFVGRSVGLREGDRLCVPVPLYHCFGMVMSNLACVVHGATMVYPFSRSAARRCTAFRRCSLRSCNTRSSQSSI
jgi:fatty-acyl-CoA synthase